MLKRKLKKRLLINGGAAIIAAAGIVVTGAGVNDKLNTVGAANYYVAAASVNENNGACGFTENENSLTFYVKNAKFADLHYIVNGGGILNVAMHNDGFGNFSYTVNSLKKGDKIKYFFTYDPGKGALDTKYSTYTFQGKSSIQADNQGGSPNNSSGTTNNNNANNSIPSNGYVVPSIDSSFIPVTNPASKDYNSIFMQLNNKTNGKYNDSQIYWCIIGLNSNKEWSYLDSNGNLVPLSRAEKEAVSTPMGNTRVCSKIYNKLSDKKKFYLPSIESGRMYISYGEPIHITVNNGGYAGPDLNNADDPNQKTYFEFIEFTTSSNNYAGADHGKESVWINTSRVDFYSFPVVARLVGRYDTNSKNYNYDKTVGDLGNRDDMFKGFKNSVPNEFKALANERRIMAPCKSVFNVGQANANYFDKYINAFWDKYSKENLVFKCDAGNYRGRIVNGVLKFTKDEDSTILGYVYKPTTQDVLEGKGSFDKRTNITNEASGVQELVVEAQLCAAFNRGVALHPELWNNVNYYYKGYSGYDNLGANFYSAYLHEKAINNKTYGFCYDDVNDWSSSMYCADSKAFVLDLGW